MGTPFTPGERFDSLSEFSGGMSSDVPPVLLPRNQVAYARNCTFRKGFATNRPSFREISLQFEDGIETAFEQGLWQGCGFYGPDAGVESLIASIGGRLFKVVPAGSSASVTEITPDTPNSATSPTAWIWQGENFLFINDGQTPTAIYDGAIMKRATQGEVVGTISNTWTVPGAKESVVVTFTTEYTGPQNVPLYAYSAGGDLLGTFEVNAESSSSGYSARLTNIDDAEGALYQPDEEINIINSWSGTSVTAGTPTTYTDPNTAGTKFTMQQNGHPGPAEYQRQTIQVTPMFTGSVGSRVVFPGLNRELIGFRALECVVVEINVAAQTIKLDRDDGPSLNNQPYVAIPAGAALQLMNAGSDQLVAITTQAFTAPAVGQYVDVTVDRLITLNNQTVYVQDKRYSIAPTPAVPTSSLYLKAIGPYQPGALISANATLQTIPQLPVGRMGVYGMGRNWVALPDGQSFVASDLVGSTSGSVAYDYRDAILNITENSYLAGGGAFRVPTSGNQITAMIFPATLDASLGQGPLQVFTDYDVFSCNAPIDREQWQDYQQPILTQSLIANGSTSHYGTVISNGDAIFRAPDGIRSLILGRRDFLTRHGNSPISVEMEVILDADNQALLNYASTIVFGNRVLMTANPVQASLGVYHDKIIAMNLDPSSTLRDVKSDIYDGVWDGMNVLQLVRGKFQGQQRAFAFCLNSDLDRIELHEILLDASGVIVDNDDDPIEMEFHTPVVFNQSQSPNRELLRLVDGEIIVEDIRGDVDFEVYYRPDYDPEWRLWHSWSVEDSPSWQPRMGLGEPDAASDPVTERPYRIGYNFQFKIVARGHCRFMGINVQAVTSPVRRFAGPMPSTSST